MALSLAAHVTGLRTAGAFKATRKPAARVVPKVTGWRAVGRAYSQAAVTGQRSTSGVGARSASLVTGHRNHGAVSGSQAPKPGAVVGD